MLNLTRSLSMRRLRLLRNTLLSALGMAAIVMGLLAMHSSGAEHGGLPGSAVVSSASVDAAQSPAVQAAASSGAHCDGDCWHDLMGCALAVMGCAMLLGVAVSLLFAHRPGFFRSLLDAGGRAGIRLRGLLPPSAPRPDLVILSISRT
ncbi:hypothetical protein ACFOE1_07715 [Agromyces mediolanus]|uniref:hypothetical protein n=1 Tax=Agromyces mediolanus TaxID=41986 RepID=UPI001665BBE1|nr:hypothetical protein [Agromyces mediolanus]